MSKDPYQVLGVPPTADDEEIKHAYRELVKKYHPDKFAGDKDMADLANEKMSEVNEAYEAIKKMREGGSAAGGATRFDARAIRLLINQNDFPEASRRLEAVPFADRNAEWHFLQSMVLMQRGWTAEAMRELGMARAQDPHNAEYQRAYAEFERRTRAYGNTYYGSSRNRRSTNEDAMCNLCGNLLIADCCCECMGGDLIPGC